ncbi:MAG: hypothetical protein KC609_04955 [Myxococcales bacterium]|nr:hypothetical protein [Myxococcales bacterium]
MEKKTDPASGRVYLSEFNPYDPPKETSFRAAEKRRVAIAMLLILGTAVTLIVLAVI